MLEKKPHGNKGKVASAETRERMRVAARKRWEDSEYRSSICKALGERVVSDETRKKRSVAMKGRPHKPFPEETKEKMRDAKLGKPGYWTGIKRGPQSAEWRAKISKANFGRPAYYPNKRFYYKDTPFRSSWERFVAIAFDKKDIKWKYEHRRFDLGSKTYTPDFYLSDFDYYWEVKGWYGPKSKAVVDLFREKYPEIPVVVATEPVIRMLDPSFNPKQM